MPATITGLHQTPRVHRSQTEGWSPSGRSGGGFRSAQTDSGETDFYLRRSYAIVERLRRAVAERHDESLPVV